MNGSTTRGTVLMLIASNGMDSCIGSLTVDWERFFEWKQDVPDQLSGLSSSLA